MKILCLSLVTNKVVATPYRDIRAEVQAEYASKNGEQSQKSSETVEEKEEAVSHEEVLEIGRQAAKEMSGLVAKVVEMAGPIL